VSRAFDVAVATLGLVLCSPLLLLAIVAIRLESKGSPIYRQRRVGKDGEPFDMLKLRTMVAGAEFMGAGLAINAGDPRVTRVGRLLRRLSLDELPNLVNVVRGEMAIVGPRPTIQAQVDQYTDRQRRRLEVKPGITGWAQVNYPYGASLEDTLRKLEYDLYYIRHFSFLLDASIVLKTIHVMLFGKGR